jgi:hypothetical protein
MNDLSDQTVMVFDDSAARGSAIPTPSEGMVTYLKDTNLLEQYDGSGFEAVSQPGILQVLSATRTTAFSTTSTSFTGVTGLSVTITPSAASSKILVIADVWGSMDSSLQTGYVQLARGGTAIAVSTDSTGVIASIAFSSDGSSRQPTPGGINFLDSPSTTSATTYSLEAKVTGNTMFINRWALNTDVGAVSSITVMEVAG